MSTPTHKATPARPKMRFRLIAGQHVHGKYDDAQGIPRQRVYNVNDVLESETNLAARWPEKFVSMDNDTKLSAPSPTNQVQAVAAPTGPASGAAAEALLKDLNLDKMNVKELTDFATAEEIDLKGSKDKTEILKIIRASFTS